MEFMSSLCLIVLGLVGMYVSKIDKQQKEIIDKIDSLRRMIVDSSNVISSLEDDLHE